ncbi:hypothetical protein SteCoe_44 [Stentor coeruleus]|uniref:Uncharacterized protein n=1 Tax=Stentor coeruleus TaxID=5963 RepID=A0A1R2D4W5_9CILI|nr:hypothetical protein SteCoe_44 [Stentor coeruleus]
MFIEDTQDNSTTSSEECPSLTKKRGKTYKLPAKLSKKVTAVDNFFKFIKPKKNPNQIIISFPKKEYIRCKLIRGTKKSIRNLGKKAFPKKIGNFENISSLMLDNWNTMMHYFQENQKVLSLFSSTQDKIPDKETKSYNLKFCKMFFERSEVREAFQFYVKYLFSDYDCNRLCKEFNFQCCRGHGHTLECGKKWEELKHFILNDMVEEIGFKLEDEGNWRDEGNLKDENFEGDKENQGEKLAFEETPGLVNLMCVEEQPKWIQKMIFREYLMNNTF